MEETAAEQGFTIFGLDPFLLMIVGIFVLMYFMTIRPQQKRAKSHRALIASIKEGDEVMSAGGIVGTISTMDEHYVTVKSEGTVIRLQRSSITATLPKGTL